MQTEYDVKQGEPYVVKEGDTLSEIIYSQTGNSSSDVINEIAKNNNIENPDLIVPGQEIVFDKSNYVTDAYKESHKDEFVSTQSTNNSINESNGQAGNSVTNDVQSNQSQGVMNEKIEEINDKMMNAVKEIMTPQKNMKEFHNTNNKSGSLGASYGTNFEICYPNTINGFYPSSAFLSFVVKENAGESFVGVNNCVKKCCEDIDGIIQSLNILKQKMGVNPLTTEQIEKVTKGLAEKKQDLVTKNSELITTCYEVIEYVYTNKENKSKEAGAIATTIKNINIYKG